MWPDHSSHSMPYQFCLLSFVNFLLNPHPSIQVGVNKLGRTSRWDRPGSYCVLENPASSRLTILALFPTTTFFIFQLYLREWVNIIVFSVPHYSFKGFIYFYIKKSTFIQMCYGSWSNPFPIFFLSRIPPIPLLTTFPCQVHEPFLFTCWLEAVLPPYA